MHCVHVREIFFAIFSLAIMTTFAASPALAKGKQSLAQVLPRM